MHWVDHQGYFGPNRRAKRGGMRLRERRGEDCAGRPPYLQTALRQLRMRVLEAHGAAGVGAFAERAKAVALLADARGEREASLLLSHLAAEVARGRDRDMRQEINEQLARVHDALRNSE